MVIFCLPQHFTCGELYLIKSDGGRQMAIKSDFAILDVKGGRTDLEQRFREEPGLRIPVVIYGYIDGIHGNDDGVSREFNVQVQYVRERVPA